MNAPGLGLVDILKQHRPFLVFEALSKPQDKEVVVSCALDNTSFQSVGSSFEAAKQQTAVRVLQHLMIRDPKIRTDLRFEPFLSGLPSDDHAAAGDSQQTGVPATAQNMSPLMYFNQIAQSDAPQWELQHLSFRPSSFKAVLTVKERQFEAVDHTKKLAKHKVAKQALFEVYGVTSDTLRMPILPKRRYPNDESAPSDPSAQSPSVPMKPESDPQEATAAAGPIGNGSNGTAGTTDEPPPKKKRRSGPPPHFRAKMAGQKKAAAADGSGSRCPCYSRERHPLQVLNEFRRGIAFKLISMEGPSHAPTITMTAEVDGRMFEARATSKQRAKTLVGAQIVDFFEEAGLLRLETEDESAVEAAPPGQETATGPAEPPAGRPPRPEGRKTPLMRLYELMPSRPSCDTWEEKEEKLFVASFSINGQTFQGRGVTKQKAKHAAAEQILKDVFNVTVEPPQGAAPANFMPPAPDTASMMT